jgi:tetratricopeptide (TPR) repeat protein
MRSFDRGVVYDSEGQYAQAIADYDEAIKHEPGPNVFMNRGVAYYHNGQAALAVQDFDRAILLDPDDAQAYFARGAAYVALADYDHAIADFDQATVTIRASLQLFRAVASPTPMVARGWTPRFRIATKPSGSNRMTRASWSIEASCNSG